MIYIALFVLGGFFGVIASLFALMVLSTKYHKRRQKIYTKAGGLYRKAYELFESAKLWAIIGDKNAFDDTLDEAHRLSKEAKTCEDEADGKKTS